MIRINLDRDGAVTGLKADYVSEVRLVKIDADFELQVTQTDDVVRSARIMLENSNDRIYVLEAKNCDITQEKPT